MHDLQAYWQKRSSQVIPYPDSIKLNLISDDWMNTNMTKAEEIIRLENDIMADEKLKEKLDSAVKEAINSGKCTNDADALVRAAKSLGYEISMAEMERHFAEKEEV